jgi:hypothetical protein
MNPYTIKYKTEEKSNYIKYIFDFVFNSIGLSGLETDRDDAEIYYGNEQILLDHGIVIRRNKTDLIWQDLIKEEINPDSIGKIVPFDIINAIGCFLTDRINNDSSKNSYDLHNRLIFRSSAQFKQNIADFPIVNLYILFLKSILKKSLSVDGFPMWPEGKKMAIGLSHDVDRPDKYAILRTPLINKKANLKDNITRFTRISYSIVKYLTDRKRENFWLFKEIMDEESKHGFSSVFFFASVNSFSNWGSGYDVDYNIQTPKFIQVFQEISNRGFEIGLHASYNACLNSKRFIFEKRVLKEASGFNIKGVRHHYWHLGKDVEAVLEMHETAGFEYDSSLAFNDALGFRRNVALPYYPWIENADRPLKTMQLPVFCMDGSLFSHSTEAGEAADKVKKYINIIKKYSGLGMMDWHVRTSYPKNSEFDTWGKSYLKILDYLSGESDVWVTNPGEIHSWLKKRESVLTGIT